MEKKAREWVGMSDAKWKNKPVEENFGKDGF